MADSRPRRAKGARFACGALLAVALFMPRVVAMAAPAPQGAGPAAATPLKGKIIGIDPGHNGRNWTDPSFLSRKIWNGREWEDCDTTGTRTAKGC
ncbi:MAG: hypothetical protein ACTHJW_07235, partial [Streptosporangiaceae bacterium]